MRPLSAGGHRELRAHISKNLVQLRLIPSQSRARAYSSQRQAARPVRLGQVHNLIQGIPRPADRYVPVPAWPGRTLASSLLESMLHQRRAHVLSQALAQPAGLCARKAKDRFCGVWVARRRRLEGCAFAGACRARGAPAQPTRMAGKTVGRVITWNPFFRDRVPPPHRLIVLGSKPSPVIYTLRSHPEQRRSGCVAGCGSACRSPRLLWRRPGPGFGRRADACCDHAFAPYWPPGKTGQTQRSRWPRETCGTVTAARHHHAWGRAWRPQAPSFLQTL